MAEKLKRLVVIDGKSVFYRGYFAMPNLSTKDGVPTGGVYGFATMALEIIRKLNPDYVCVAWDKPKTNIRKRLEIYPKYKAGRKPPPPDFYPQIPLLHELLDAFGWPLYELDDYEADDIMGALAVQGREQNIETILVTSDLDMLQLVNGHVKVYALKKGLSNIEEFHVESFIEKYEITPDQFIDLKALKGDSSDNIPGVPGIGEKGAIALLKEHKNLDGIYENIELISGSTKTKLIAGKDSAYMSHKLAEIWVDAPIKLDLTEVDGSKCDPNKVLEVLQKLEFRSLVRQLPEIMKVDATQTISASKVATKLKVPENIFITTHKDLEKLKFTPKDILYVYGRCAGRHGRSPSLLSISFDPSKVYTIDIKSVGLEKTAQALKDSGLPNTRIVGYDAKNVYKMLLEMGLDLPDIEHDVLVGAFLINSLRKDLTLTELAQFDLGYSDIVDLDNLPDEELASHIPEIIAVIRGLHGLQAEQMSELTGVIKLASDVEFPVIPVLAKMEHEGIKLNTTYLNKFATQLEDTISDLEQTIYGYADQEFNIASPSQLADILFNKLQLPTDFIKKGKTGYSTAASELAKLRAQHPIIELISQFREVTKLKNTYVDTLPKMVDENSRLHTTFNMTTAQTGRLSSLDPNLQNIPVRTELGKHIRTAFEADPGKVLISADYSQFELRLAAVLAGDKDMIEAFNNDQDIHTLTAASVLGIDPKDVTRQQRYEAKAVNFGILYGQGPHGLAEGTGMTFKDAKDFIDKYFEVRPKLKEYIKDTREMADKKGYVETLLGRRRPSPDVKSSNFMVREGAFRAAVNMPIQGTAADLTKLAMVKIDEKITDGCKMLLQIHDSILLECPEKEVDKYSKILKETMENIYELPVKLKVDISSGKNWGEL
jgi:DNA polymerase I